MIVISVQQSNTFAQMIDYIWYASTLILIQLLCTTAWTELVWTVDGCAVPLIGDGKHMANFIDINL